MWAIWGSISGTDRVGVGVGMESIGTIREMVKLKDMMRMWEMWDVMEMIRIQTIVFTGLNWVVAVMAMTIISTITITIINIMINMMATTMKMKMRTSIVEIEEM